MYSIKFTDEHLAVLNDALVKLPFYVAAPVIAHINDQIRQQRAGEDERTDQGRV